METFTQDGITVQSNTATQEELQAAFDEPSPEQPTEEAPPVDGAPPPDPAAKAGDPPKVDKRTREGKFKSIQAEIDAATAEKSRAVGETTAAKTERDRLNQEIQNLRTQREALTKAPAAEQPEKRDPNAEPQEADFETYREYVKAQARWEARQELQTYQQTQQQRETQQRADRFREMRETRFNERREAGKAKYHDFDVKMEAANLPLSRPMMDVITDSEITADVMYHLATHPDEAQRIFAIGVYGQDGKWYPNEIQQFREMSLLEGRLSAAVSGPAQRTPAISQAPAPVKPLRGTPNAADNSEPDPATASQEEFDAYWNKRARG